MNKNNQFGHSFKRQIRRFINKKLVGLGKVSERFIFEMIFGICKSCDVKISNIGRALNEKCKLSHTLKRLYNRLNSCNYADTINAATLRGYPKATDETIFALDFSDICKPFAKKMEYLSDVRDGDKGTMGRGYNQVTITATELTNENPVVLSNELFSKCETPDKKSTDVALSVLEKQYTIYGEKGIHVQDRYFDNKRFFTFYAEKNKQFVTRAKSNRKLLKVDSQGKVIPGKIAITELAKHCKTSFTFITESWENGKWVPKKTVRVGSRKVFLPCINQIISLVVIKGFGRIPMMLLTNIEINVKKQKELRRIFSIYRARWKCEEWIRYIKQEYNLEDLRCLNYLAIKNVVSIVTFVTCFLSKRIGLSPQLEKMRLHVLHAGMPIFQKKAKLILYIISEGVRNILQGVNSGFRELRSRMTGEIQLCFDL